MFPEPKRKENKTLSDLPCLPLYTIAGMLKCPDVFRAYRSTCKACHASAPIKVFTGVSKVPLLMLEKPDDDGKRELYSFPGNKVVMTVDFPASKVCFGAGFGWVIIQAMNDDVSLLDPVSGAQFLLPTLSGIDDYGMHPPIRTIQSAALSSDPSSDPNFVVAIIVTNVVLGTWKVGDEKWREEFTPYNKDKGFANVTLYRGKFHVLKWRGDIFVMDPSGREPFKKIMNVGIYFYDDHKVYLVETFADELLLVEFSGSDKDIRLYFKVYKIDVVEKTKKRILSLENRALFVGNNAAICIKTESAWPDEIKARIYFTQEQDNNEDEVRSLQKAMGIFNMEKDPKVARRTGMDLRGYGRLESFIDIQDINPVSPCLWLDSSGVSKSLGI